MSSSHLPSSPLKHSIEAVEAEPRGGLRDRRLKISTLRGTLSVIRRAHIGLRSRTRENNARV